jgi:hypothetical protein
MIITEPRLCLDSKRPIFASGNNRIIPLYLGGIALHGLHLQQIEASYAALELKGKEAVRYKLALPRETKVIKSEIMRVETLHRL